LCRFVPIWMATDAKSVRAAVKAAIWPVWDTASPIPPTTGLMASRRVFGRAVSTHSAGFDREIDTLGSPRELAEIRLALLEECVSTLLSLGSRIEESGRIARQLLNPGEAVRVGIESGFEDTQGGR
jgi:hypothetical protein